MKPKIRTVYFKADDITALAEFWSKLLKQPIKKDQKKYKEIQCQNINLGFVLNDFGSKFSGSNAAIVFEFDDDELATYVERAKQLGAKVLHDGLEDPNLLSIVFVDPFGNEFELSKFHG